MLSTLRLSLSNTLWYNPVSTHEIISVLQYFFSIFSDTPAHCQSSCLCSYNQTEKANSMVCKHKLPTAIPDMTNWLTITEGNIGQLSGQYPYFNQIWYLNLRKTGINGISESSMELIVKGKSIRWIDLSGNNLLMISKTITQGHFERIWLSGNEFSCTCDMLWMVNWLANTTSPAGHVIQDYKEILCHTPAKYKGTPIYTINATYMNCLPTKVPTWGIGLISGAGILIIAIVITIVVIARRWNEVKLLMYLHFNILNKNDNDASDLNDFQFDALLSYT